MNKVYKVTMDTLMLACMLTALYMTWRILKQWEQENDDSDSLPPPKKPDKPRNFGPFTIDVDSFLKP